MTISYHSGERIQATSTDFGTDGAGIPAVSGGWKEVGRTTLGSAGDTISVASLPDKRYYMVLYYVKNDDGNAINCNNRFNSDTGTNYRFRSNSSDGGGEYTPTSQTSLALTDGSGAPHLIVEYIANLPTKEKLTISHVIRQRNPGAGNSPSRSEVVGKWSNTSSSISSLSANNAGAGSYASGSEVVVLGWDDTDTHTTNFWEELASVNASGSSTNLSSGTISAKKYLWVQCYTEGNSGDILNTFNNDSGNNYCRRGSTNGGTDYTSTSQPSIANMHNGGNGEPSFSNWFIINNASNEKLATGHSVQQNTAGAGNAPRRIEFVGKWVNTSSQITEIDFDSQSGNFGTNSFIKVWGSD